jgi:hypothetical protein
MHYSSVTAKCLLILSGSSATRRKIGIRSFAGPLSEWRVIYALTAFLRQVYVSIARVPFSEEYPPEERYLLDGRVKAQHFGRRREC